MMLEQEQFMEAAAGSLEAGTFVKLTMTRYGGGETGLNSLSIRLLKIKGETKLSFGYRYKTKDLVKNFAIAPGLKELRSQTLGVFKSLRLFTTTKDWELTYNKRMQPRLVQLKAAFGETSSGPQGNDRTKKRYIEAANNIYLEALGIANAQGTILKGRESKFKQINKFVEILDSLYKTSSLQDKAVVSAIDMGSGKGYLTFATYDFLTNLVGKEAIVTGIETRPELVNQCNGIAEKAGFSGLKFEAGAIGDSIDQACDIAIALHACDTATDDAIYKGIKAQAAMIILSPCCHKQIRREMDQSREIKRSLQHGILIERQAEIVTDRLRSLFLELSGYHTKVFEFIDSEHTSKNLMITAVKSDRTVDETAVLQEIQALKGLYFVRSCYLENLLFPETLLNPSLASSI
ncbi:MAG: SAM-dependent methyltransferase [Alkalinema sp. RU_4_3]|nr:SAM-dependent methyltransferase [Alkalinema sp. RU_4_3]